LRRAIEKLGPAYVKVAQALSTRVDILSPSYLAEIERLQDRVPTFSDTTAWNAIAEGLGPVEATFAKLSPSPVAAASLGQVYKGVLLPALGGHAVAVKVRRPGVQAQVALDLHIMRQVAVAARRLPSVRSNWAGVIDAWAVSFLEEMDYELESDNARRFKADVAAEQLSGIVVPEVYQATAGVLVSEWIDGEKLSESRSGDVRELCNTLLNSYLVQLLDTGFLHAVSSAVRPTLPWPRLGAGT
jgi:aarF domain-containing kinase